MRKSTRIVKKFMTLFLVVLMSINTFAAVVSDNDGAAFITKAEFDSLKNDFQSQINRYNESIDNKIDGAIANYLNGIKVEQVIPSTFMTSSYKTVNFMNKTILPTYNFPDLELNIASSNQSRTNNNNAKTVAFVYGFSYSKTYGANDKTLRPLVNVSGSEQTPGKFYWNGIANRYHERLVVTNLAMYYNWSDFGYMDWGVNCFRFKFINPYKFKKNGYISGFGTDKSFWKGTYKYAYNQDRNGKTFPNTLDPPTPDAQIGNNMCQVSLDEVGGTLKNHEHIIQYKNDTNWYVSNETFLSTIREGYGNTLKAKKWLDDSTKTPMSIFEGAVGGANPLTGKLSVIIEQDANELVPSIGYIGAVNAENLYQDINSINFDYESNKYTLTDQKVGYGLPIHPATNGSTYEFELSFGEVITETTAGRQTNQNEVDVYVSYGPFTDMVNSSNLASLRENWQSQNANYVTTTNRECKFTIEATRDDVLYLKCLPHFDSADSSYLDNYWDIELNLVNSKIRYKR